METERRILKKEFLGQWFEKITAAGNRILAPRQKEAQVHFEPITSPTELAVDVVQSTVSAKRAVFPPVEEMMAFSFTHKETTPQEKALNPQPTVVYGIRPCDAAAFATLHEVFTRDYVDDLFMERWEKTTFISVSCVKADAYCFCTSVGGGPGNTLGSDILLTPLADGNFLVELITEKGKVLVAQVDGLFSDSASNIDKESALAQLPPRFDGNTLKAKIEATFENESLWAQQAMRCIACGACAYVCPTCQCFDIQDERFGSQGKRLRCWDSCCFPAFTLHTSGHNPRHNQTQRWRQRLMHKFSYEPDNLQVPGCVGCGRCSRACPTDMNILTHLLEIAEVQS